MVENKIWAVECCLCKNAIETSKRKKKLHGSSCIAAREVLQVETGNSFVGVHMYSTIYACICMYVTKKFEWHFSG